MLRFIRIYSIGFVMIVEFYVIVRINYVLYEELDAKDVERTRDIYK